MPQSDRAAKLREIPECAARYATPRTSRKSYGPAVAERALSVGWRLMPWQRQVLDVALEFENGIPAYRTVVVTVPRQNGKTTLLWALMLWRALHFPKQEIVATAQTGQEAMEKWRDYVLFMDEQDAVSPLIENIRRSNGTELLRWVNGSRHRTRAPTAKAGHGLTIDLAIIDEAWALKDEVVLQTFRPAMVTRPGAQLWIVSTAGTRDSMLLKRHVELGREAIEAGKSSGVCYFEWSAPEGLAPDDVEAWRQAMPALGHTIDESVIRADYESGAMTASEWERAYLNRWTEQDNQVVTSAAWYQCLDPEAAPGNPLWLGIDMTPERDSAAIVAAGWYGDRVGIELIAHHSGTEWLSARVNEILNQHDVAGIVIDGTGPAAAITDEINAKCTVLSHRGIQHASAQFYDAILYHRLAVRPHEDLTRSVKAARQMGNGDMWRWGRKGTSDVCSLIAATAAYYQCRANKGGTLRIW
jgi:phage terminase large subunit-like protein